VKDYGFTTIDYLNITKGFNSKEVNDYDVILLHGGNPFTIKERMKKSGFHEFLPAAHPLIVTTSGSTMVLSNNFEIFNILYPKMKKDDFVGLALFPCEIIPHYQRYKKKENDIKNFSRGKKIYAIPDGSAIAYNGKNIKLIGPVKILD
jgi:peptidase E